MKKNIREGKPSEVTTLWRCTIAFIIIITSSYCYAHALHDLCELQYSRAL